MDESVFRRYQGKVVWGPFEDLSPEELNRVEDEIGRRLPQEFRDFLLVAHGGTFPYAVRLPPGDPDGEFVEFDDLVRAMGDWGLARMWADFPTTWMAEHLPAGLLQVARDGGGSALYLSLAPETYGSVWAFVHGLPPWAGGRQTDSGGAVAESWSAYLDLLTIAEDHAAEVWAEAQVGPEASWTAAVVAWLDSGLPDWRARTWASTTPGAPPRRGDDDPST